MHIIIVSAHPDDAETAAGGMIAKFAAAGHDVTILHGGPAAIGLQYQGRPSCDVRTEEAQAAADILGAKLDFFEWGHSIFEFNRQTRKQLADYLTAKKPDLVVAHWAVDTHPDHQVISALTTQAFIRQNKWQLAFFEVYAGIQTLEFTPNRYVDITDVIDQKNRSILCHASQDPQPQLEMHEKMSRFRGIEFGVEHAEAFRMMGLAAAGPADEVFDPPRWYGRSD